MRQRRGHKLLPLRKRLTRNQQLVRLEHIAYRVWLKARKEK